MIDVDFFKSYNDVFGHLAGDDALRKIAMIIKNCVLRKSDLVARYGGEEFCVVLLDTISENAYNIAEKIREKVYTEKIHRNPIEGFEWITVSIGVKTLIVDENTDISTEIAQADTALYQAKNTGRNRTQIFKD
ncbi:MAG TPA: diguanylate cyclase, partial [Gammaproteobacteria bacterium]|nr:diguanylate cyclase [Gammaproteobacteria bacterium]